MINIEQVENLRKHADVTYEEAKAALEESGGDMLEAIILLEKQGKVDPPRNNGRFSTGDLVTTETYGSQGEAKGGNSGDNYSFGDQMHRLWQVICKIVHKGNINHFVVIREGKEVISVPVTVLVISLAFFFWITLPAMVIGLFFGCVYNFRGPDLGKDSINSVMDNATETAENIKKSFSEDQKRG